MAFHKYVVRKIIGDFTAEAEPVQIGAAEHGAAKLVHRTRVTYESRPDFIVLEIDITNAFNATKRREILRRLRESSAMKHLRGFVGKILRHKYQICLNGRRVQREDGTHVLSEEGVVQGDPLSSPLFTNTIQREVQAMNDILQPLGGCATAGADDVFVTGPADEVIDAVERFGRRVGDNAELHIQLTKTKVLCKNAVKAAEVAEIIEVRRGFDGTVNECPLPGFAPKITTEGIECFGIPIGTHNYIEGKLQERITKIKTTIDKATDLLGQNNHHELWTLNRISLQHKFGYWCALVPTLHTCAPNAAAATFDSYIRDISTIIFGPNFAALQEATAPGLPDQPGCNLPNFRYHMRLKDKGLGIISARDTAPAAYLGAATCAIRPFAYTTAEGTVLGSATHLRHLVGAPSLDSDEKWAAFLATSNPTATAVTMAFHQISRTVETTRRTLTAIGQGHVLLEREGDVTQRPLHNFSVGRDTRQRILSELDRHKKALTDALAENRYPLHHMARLAWTHCDVQISPKVFEVLPTSETRRLEDAELQICAEQYLGIPKASCEALIGRRIIGGGHNTDAAPRLVDAYGSNFHTVGVRNEWKIRHDSFHTALRGLATWAYMTFNPEAYGLFSRHFPVRTIDIEADESEEQFLARQAEHNKNEARRRQGCRPDFLFHVPFYGLAELKFIGAVPSHYALDPEGRLANRTTPGAVQRGDPRHEDYIAPVEGRAATVHREYEAKLKMAAIPSRVVSEATEDDRARGAAAVAHLNTEYGQVRPLVVGVFSEINVGLRTLLRSIVDSRLGRQTDPDSSDDGGNAGGRERDAKSVATNYVRQTVGVAAAKANAKFILQSLSQVEGITDPELLRLARERRAILAAGAAETRRADHEAFLSSGGWSHADGFQSDLAAVGDFR